MKTKIKIDSKEAIALLFLAGEASRLSGMILAHVSTAKVMDIDLPFISETLADIEGLIMLMRDDGILQPISTRKLASRLSRNKGQIAFFSADHE